MKRPQDPCRCPASEARDDWADAPRRTLDDYDIWHKPCENCGFDPGKGESSRCWHCGRRVYRDFSDRALKKSAADPNNLEGPGPSDEERRANAKAISALPVHERFALMFGHGDPKTVDTNPES